MCPRLGHCAFALALSALWMMSWATSALAADVTFSGSDAEGSVAVFSTTDKLIPGDTDIRRDVYERSFDIGVGDYVTREVSTGPSGGNDAYDATFQGVSTNGREVFFSTQERLVAGDADFSVDVYARNLVTGKTALVSAALGACSSGPCGNGAAGATYKGASTDGLTVFFETSESLSPEDGDEASDVYVRDLAAEPPTTTLVSQAAASCTGSCGSGEAAETFVGSSSDGGQAFFETTESLASTDGDSTSDIYMRNLAAEPSTTTLVSAGGVCPSGVEPSACRPKFRGAADDGSRVFFTSSEQYSGGAADTDKGADVYAWEGGTPLLLSIGTAGGNAEGMPAIFAGATPGGSTVFFETGEALTADDADLVADVYARDPAAGPGTTTLVSRPDSSCVSVGCGGGAGSFDASSESGDAVFFQTTESLVPADSDGLLDIYVRDLGAETTELVSTPAASCGGGCGPAAAVKFAAASASGDSVAFTTAEPLAPADEDTSEDVYVRDLDAATTTLESKDGICPLPGEAGCDSTFAGASEDTSHMFFRTAERLTAEDVDSDLDVYEREGSQTRLVSAGNSVSLGPSTPVLTGTSPASKGETTTPRVLGSADDGTSIKIYTTPDCSGETVAGSVAELQNGGIAVTVEPGTTSFRATATDENGDTSGCSNAVAYTQEVPPPPNGEEPGGDSGGGGGSSEGSGGGSTTSGGGGSGGASSPRSSGDGSAPVKLTPDGVPYVTPITQITFGPAFKTRVRRPVFRFADATGQPGTRFICRVDRGKWSGCASPVRLRHLRRGRHVFRVKAVNAVGTWEAHPTARAFKLVGRGGGHNRTHRRHGAGGRR